MLTKNDAPTQELKSLLNGYMLQRERVDFNSFKIKAMSLVNKGADISISEDTNGFNLFHVLVSTNHHQVNNPEIEQLLKMNKGLVNQPTAKEKFTPLQVLMNMQATSAGVRGPECFEMTALILARHGADLTVCDNHDAQRYTFMHHLVLGDIGSVKQKINILLEIDPTLINVKDSFGRTPLQNLIRSRLSTTIEDIQFFESLGANLHTKDNNQETPLHAAIISNKLDIAKYLISKQLDIHEKTKSNQTMLHLAVDNCNEHTWNWLHQQHVDINAQDINGHTALHLAAIRKHSRMMQWLVNQNADVCVVNKKNKSPIDLISKDDTTADILLNAGAIRSDDLGTATASTPEDLLTAINGMRKYGALLQNNHANKKGKILTDLADELTKYVESNFKDNTKPASFVIFRNQFLLKLNSKQKHIEQYRFALKTVLINISIALTGLGLFAIAAKLAHSKKTYGRALFFSQKKTTTSEDKAKAIEASINTLTSARH